MPDLIHLPEPRLLFGYNQSLEDPRDGLTLLGPHDPAQNYGVKYGVVATKEGSRRLRNWISKLQGPISEVGKERSRPPYPGFEAAFGMPWSVNPALELSFGEEELRKVVMLNDRHKRNFETVRFFTELILRAIRDEEVKPEVWIIVIPNFVRQFCRPESIVLKSDRIEATGRMSMSAARKAVAEPFLFGQLNKDAEAYQYEPDFHNQLKGRLLAAGVVTQIIQEGTIAHHEFLKPNGRPLQNLDSLQSQIAWNLSSAMYYKLGARPWKLDGVREGVCYLGLVFKQDTKHVSPETACCAAQMFLDSGDGVVFKGNIGPWYAPKTGEFHLNATAARTLLEQALESYRSKHDGRNPKEVFIHGKVRYSAEEWRGFLDATPSETNLVGVRIHEAKRFRLYRVGSKMPVLRGLAWVQDYRSAILMTRGYIPRMETYPGMEVPLPLEVEICRGEADIQQVLNDVMGLTKLNYNSCRHSDGWPVTLKFADAVGEVLISGPAISNAPLAFKHYI